MHTQAGARTFLVTHSLAIRRRATGMPTDAATSPAKSANDGLGTHFSTAVRGGHQGVLLPHSADTTVPDDVSRSSEHDTHYNTSS
jgi:hypothetical protein